jgi:hypothetical protein
MNTFKRFALGAVLALACSIACAATLTLATDVLEHGTIVAKGSVTYYGLTPDEMNATLGLANAIPAAADKLKGKGGAYTVRLTAFVDEAPQGFKQIPPAVYEGLTFRGVNRLMRVETKVSNDFIDLADEMEGSGDKRAWGGDRKAEKHKK